jgi:hypothetical protein
MDTKKKMISKIYLGLLRKFKSKIKKELIKAFKKFSSNINKSVLEQSQH